ncbi:MAG: TraB/GumN family protein [Erythrobacter sp.]|nr:TraB/GumN family protein [Erythrobacter sp.]
MFRKALLAAFTFLLSACGYPDTALAQEASPPSGPAIWRLGDEDTTIYLFGTIHVLPEGENWFSGNVRSAFDASDELVFEISMDDVPASAAALAQMALLPQGTTLRSLMTEDNRAEYEATLAQLGVAPERLDPFEPWAAALDLSLRPLAQAGYQAGQGVELVLREHAEGRQRAALETVEQQVELFDSLPMADQLTLLDETVEGIPETLSTLDALKAEWLAGDADAIATLMNADMADGDLYERLLVNRNRNWAGWIADRLDRPGTVFIAVGAGHLAGADSVQQQLAARGIAVERVGN